MNERCRAFRPLIGASLLGSLEPELAPALAEHLAGCGECRAEAGELEPVARALSSFDPRAVAALPGPPADLGDRVLARVREERRRTLIGRWSRRAWPAAAAVAAAIILVVGLWLLVPDGAPGTPVAFDKRPDAVEVSARIEPQDWGMQIHIDVRGLQPGEVYTVQVKDRDGVLHEAGSFQVPDEEGVRSAVAVAVPRAHAVGLGINDPRGTQIIHATLG